METIPARPFEIHAPGIDTMGHLRRMHASLFSLSPHLRAIVGVDGTNGQAVCSLTVRSWGIFRSSLIWQAADGPRSTIDRTRKTALC